KPYATTMSTFNGQSPNGDWQLYVADDSSTDAGVITSGWTIGITTQPVIVGLANATTLEDTPVRVPFTVAEESFASTDFTFTSSSTNTTVVGTNGVTFSGSGTNWVALVTPQPNASGTSQITVFLTNPDGQTVSDKFLVAVTAV